VDILSIDRRDEALVDALIDGDREGIGPVLDILDQPNVFGNVCGIVEERREHARRLRQMCRQLIEKVEKLFVTGNQPREHTHHASMQSRGGR
jgi:hypothetical protein